MFKHTVRNEQALVSVGGMCGSLQPLGCIPLGYPRILSAMNVFNNLFSFLMCTVQWLIRLPRLYREEASLTAELRRLNAEFASLRELIGNEHNANAVSRNLVLAKLQQYGAQLDDRLQHHMTRAIASISRTSTRPASKLSEPELRNLMKSLNCKYATPINETNLEDLQSSGQEYNW